MITKLLTGSRLLLAETEQSGDIDYILITDNRQTISESDIPQNENQDLFIINTSEKHIGPGEKEDIFFLLITWLLHKKLDMEIENESFFEDFINENILKLNELLAIMIGFSAEIPKIKWTWVVIFAIKYLHGEWEDLTIDEIKEIFGRARSNSLTESDLNLIDDFIVEEILQKDEIMKVRGMLTPRQLEKIALYNARHETR